MGANRVKTLSRESGSGGMTPEKAKEIVFNEIDTYVNEYIDSRKEPLTEQEKLDLEEKVLNYKNRIIFTGVTQSDSHFTVKAQIVVESENAEFRLNETDRGLAAVSFQAEDGEKISMSNFLENFKSAVDLSGTRAKMVATLKDIKNIGGAIESYLTDNYEVPQVENFSELEGVLVPSYIRKLPLKDAWGNEFYYYHGVGDLNKKYSIASAGSDGIFEGFDQNGGYTDLDGKDIIYSDGNFVYLPRIKW